VLDALREAVPELMMHMFSGGEPERRWHNGNLIVNPALHPGSVEIGGRGGAGPSDAPVAVPIDPDADATRAPNTVVVSGHVCTVKLRRDLAEPERFCQA
jgi:hypothetical protein